jgi:hypothetical protein
MRDEPIAHLDGDQGQVENCRDRKGRAEGARRVMVAVAAMMTMIVRAVVLVRVVMIVRVAVIVLMRHVAIRSKFRATVEHISALGDMPASAPKHECNNVT